MMGDVIAILKKGLKDSNVNIVGKVRSFIDYYQKRERELNKKG